MLRLRARNAAMLGIWVPAGRDRRAPRSQTFKLVDQLSGRMLGLRADCTPRSRIDAHLLNRVRRCAAVLLRPVLHTLPTAPCHARAAAIRGRKSTDLAALRPILKF